MAFEDKTLVCKDCGKEFIFSAGEQEFYQERGFQSRRRRTTSNVYRDLRGLRQGNGSPVRTEE